MALDVPDHVGLVRPPQVRGEVRPRDIAVEVDGLQQSLHAQQPGEPARREAHDPSELAVQVPVRDAQGSRDVCDRPHGILLQHGDGPLAAVQAWDVGVQPVGQARDHEVQHGLGVRRHQQALPQVGGGRPGLHEVFHAPRDGGRIDAQRCTAPHWRRHDPDREGLAGRLVGHRPVMRSDQEAPLCRAAARPSGRRRSR